MTNEELKEFFQVQLKPIQDDIKIIKDKVNNGHFVKSASCDKIREGCNEKIELKLKNLKIWTIGLIIATGGNAAGALINFLK